MNPIAEKPPVQEKKEEKSIPASPEVSKAEKPVSPSTEEDKGEDEVIRARAQQLSGPKIIGKIQLPVNKKRINLLLRHLILMLLEIINANVSVNLQMVILIIITLNRVGTDLPEPVDKIRNKVRVAEVGHKGKVVANIIKILVTEITTEEETGLIINIKKVDITNRQHQRQNLRKKRYRIKLKLL